MGRENEKSNITQMFRENKGHSLKTLLLLFRGRYLALFGSVFFFVIKHSPTWVLPIVTANIINAVTDKEGDIVRIFDCEYDFNARISCPECSNKLYSYLALCEKCKRCGKGVKRGFDCKAAAAFDHVS